MRISRRFHKNWCNQPFRGNEKILFIDICYSLECLQLKLKLFLFAPRTNQDHPSGQLRNWRAIGFFHFTFSKYGNYILFSQPFEQLQIKKTCIWWMATFLLWNCSFLQFIKYIRILFSKKKECKILHVKRWTQTKPWLSPLFRVNMFGVVIPSSPLLVYMRGKDMVDYYWKILHQSDSKVE